MNANRKRVLLAASTLLVLVSTFLIGVSLILGLFMLNSRPGESKRPIRIHPIAPLSLQTAATSVTNTNSAVEQPLTLWSESLSDDQLGNRSLIPGTITDIKTDPIWTGEVETDAGEAIGTNSPLIVDSLVNSPLPTPTATPLLSTALTITSTATPTPTLNITPTATVPVTGPSRIIGRVLFKGVPIKGGVTLQLENSQTYALVAETIVGNDGYYKFENIPPSIASYNILFDQEANPQYQLGQVISWGWLGPVVVASNSTINLPEFEIALLGFEPINPKPNASFFPKMPITFEWSAYPQANKYWVDLVRGENMEPVWKSAPLQATSVTFDGQAVGSELKGGEYWWGVGARRNLGENYAITVYGYLPVLLVKP